MTNGRAIHVVADRLGRWHVQREGEQEPLSKHESLTAAERAAAGEPASEILVHDRYGRVRREPAHHGRMGVGRPPAPSTGSGGVHAGSRGSRR